MSSIIHIIKNFLLNFLKLSALNKKKINSFFPKDKRASFLITFLLSAVVILGIRYAITNQPSWAERVSDVGNSSIVITRKNKPQPNLFQGLGFFPNFPYYPINDKPGVIKALFEDVKPHVIRIELRAKWSNREGRVDANNEQMKKQIDLLKIAASKGITKWIGVHWSPPTEFRQFKSTKAMVDGKENSLREDKEDDYARYIAELVNVFVAAGAPAPYGISIQNELAFAPSSWDGMKVSKDQFRRLVKLFRQELDAAGYGRNSSQFVRVQGPESGTIVASKNWMGGNNFSYLKQDSDFADALSDIITHSYHPSKWSGGEYVDDWRNGVINYRGNRDVWMTEMCDLQGDGSVMGSAITMSREIAKHLGYIGANYWVYWMAWHPNGDSETFPNSILAVGEGTDRLPKRSKFYHVLRLLINNVQPGSKIYTFRSNDNSLFDSGKETYERHVDLLAFQSQGKSVVLMVNGSLADKDVMVQGLTDMGTSLDIYRISGRDGENGKKIGSRSIERTGKVSQTIPLSSKSVVILVTKDG